MLSGGENLKRPWTKPIRSIPGCSNAWLNRGGHGFETDIPHARGSSRASPNTDRPLRRHAWNPRYGSVGFGGPRGIVDILGQLSSSGSGGDGGCISFPHCDEPSFFGRQ